MNLPNNAATVREKQLRAEAEAESEQRPNRFACFVSTNPPRTRARLAKSGSGVVMMMDNGLVLSDAIPSSHHPIIPSVAASDRPTSHQNQ